MNSIKKTALIAFTIIASNFSFGQLSKSSCQEILSDINLANYQKLKVVSTVSSDNASNSIFNLDIATAKMFYNDGYLMLKDETGLMMNVPYDKIKLIRVAPKSGSEYAGVTIYLID